MKATPSRCKTFCCHCRISAWKCCALASSRRMGCTALHAACMRACITVTPFNDAFLPFMQPRKHAKRASEACACRSAHMHGQRQIDCTDTKTNDARARDEQRIKQFTHRHSSYTRVDSVLLQPMGGWACKACDAKRASVQPMSCCNCRQSKPAPGSCLRPGAMCSCPTMCAMG